MADGMPQAEFDVGLDLVRRLLREQHPDLAGLRLAVMANGWDNIIVRAGDELVIRMPRRRVAAQFILTEQRWLPELALRLPLPVPVPVRIGRPGAGYPWPWSVAAFLPGEIAAVSPPADYHHAAMVLGSFLGGLHAVAPPDAPVNPFRGLPIAERTARFEHQLGMLGPNVVDQEAAVQLWRSGAQARAWVGPPLWLHGDLHPANVIVRDGRISAVIDFGTLTSGDPAMDLSAAWMLLPVGCHERFWLSYAQTMQQQIDVDLRLRAKCWALGLSLSILANSADDPLMAGVGRQALAAILA